MLMLDPLVLEASTFYPSGAPSAYPLAFPEALASGPILLPGPMRRTGCSYMERRPRSYFVPEDGLSRWVGQHCLPGRVWGEVGPKSNVQTRNHVLLDPAVKPASAG